MINLDSINLEKTTIEELGELLINAKKAYYTSGKPIMDDHTYDTLEEILRKKSPHHRLFSKVGNPNFDTGFNKKHHVMPMGSQNKVNKFEDLIHYFELKKTPISEFVVQPKCDGISLEIEYQNGHLVDAITRGDGQVGDIITQNVVKMKNFVLSPDNFTGSVRCEILVFKDDFKKLNLVSEEKYSNSRNAASGLSQRLDSKFSEYCTLIAVDIFPFNKNEQSKISFLQSLGFTTVESSICKNFNDIENIYQEFLLHKRDSFPYEIDGLVIKINDSEIANKLGSQNNRPKFQVAYKFPASTNQTSIKSIAWQVGPMGSITPVAEVEPIELSGAIITFASLANYDLVKKMNVNVNDIVEISRRGDVIPHIEKVITKVIAGHTSVPTHCPSCGTTLIVEDKFLRCPNTQQCLPQIIGSLNLFCQTLEILGLSDKTISKLYESKRIKLPGDFFKLKVEDIQDLENLGEKSAKNIINQIQAKKELSLTEIFDAAIIPNFSRKRIQQLIGAGFNTPEKLLHLQEQDLLNIKGFQTTLINKIIDGINLRRSWIESIISQTTLKPETKKSKLAGLTFCITGDLSKPRKEIEKLIEDNGGQIQSGVSKNTSYLITNETSSNSSKFINAKKLNIPIINEESFSSLV